MTEKSDQYTENGDQDSGKDKGYGTYSEEASQHSESLLGLSFHQIAGNKAILLVDRHGFFKHTNILSYDVFGSLSAYGDFSAVIDREYRCPHSKRYSGIFARKKKEISTKPMSTFSV